MDYEPHEKPAQKKLSRIDDSMPHPNPLPPIAIATAPLLNRTSMLARRWQRINLFRHANRGADGRGTAEERRAKRRPVPSSDLYAWQLEGRLRRTLLLALTLFQTAIAGTLMLDVLPMHGETVLERVILVLFMLLFFWISAGFWTAMAGLAVLSRGGDRHRLVADADTRRHVTNSFKTAIVMPICNEDVARVFAGLRATYESLANSTYMQHFDFFILSDSTDTDICTAELEAWSAFRRAVKCFDNIFYRRRKRQTNRKSGNIADFCRRWGKNYRYMIVLDADSVMTGKCLTDLVGLMESNPDTGIIQTAPHVTGRNTLYARIQQFSARVYGPLHVAGLHFWQLGESHYWGHNAIIRIAPFIRHCALAPLPGRGPLSGEILSHDFIEAALMRRAGWTVWIAYDLPGSYEEMPPNLLDELRRDRRWCRGNMMNIRLIMERGIHPVYRVVFATGLMAYLSSLLWLTFLVLSTILLTTQNWPFDVDLPLQRESLPDRFGSSRSHALYLFGITASLLMLPKLLAVLHICRQGAQQFGGACRLIVSMVLESLFSILAAPIRMLFHSWFVVSAVIGESLAWRSPSRHNAETTWREGLQGHGLHTCLGLVWGTIVYWLNPAGLVWFLPAVGALALSIPLSVLSSRVSLGNHFRKMRLFLISEEVRPPEVLSAVETYHRAGDTLPGFGDAVVDPMTNALVCACGRWRTVRPAGATIKRFRLLRIALCKGPGALSNTEKRELLNDPATLFQLHKDIWQSSFAHMQWRELMQNCRSRRPIASGIHDQSDGLHPIAADSSYAMQALLDCHSNWPVRIPSQRSG